ncbi:MULTISPECIES: orotate phosphoribosyltransferase-like protein [Methanohalophilus]|jgi:orotate phosphoribosyltransferase|uniref:Transcriptional regulator GfcR n=1 Tax=Methanohalophilus euhalobius TaxID=51203 RepID=A0A285FCY4_9EURY|nr:MULTISPECIES: orotate phosphoribosyltransferase-like protein [Methanohalophilus]KXS41446.1 MAG: orotate phosphoribosyltransferase [Methanohalophilus sp. T328-1]RSD34800.1 MAG: orotate phosphoribosyltransferase [Methanohalophilus sp.]OBZ34503.1 MAG: orotate phosphoribosyltransferase [Methanohalophilus sp. DAL1]ODV50140.1 MAG: orotate phosphoribosyltransferase [Methanohalophilus sp. 2-GBenrich]PQV43004.1 orotate phosphoribosyltransferase [Methanohalophilus euhalobius]
MKNIEELIQKAVELQSNGLVTGQIANELNVSRDTVTWLLMRSKRGAEAPAPKDISVNWSAIGKSSFRLRYISQALCDMVLESLDKSDQRADMVVGIGLSGVPMATMIAEELGVEFSIFHGYDSQKERNKNTGIFSRNFGHVKGKNCIIVDDVVSSGSTITDVIEQTKKSGSNPVAIAVIIDKKNSETISGVPVNSLIKLARVD